MSDAVKVNAEQLKCHNHQLSTTLHNNNTQIYHGSSVHYCKLRSALLSLKASNYFLPFLSNIRISAEHPKQWHFLTLKLAPNSMKSLWNSCSIPESRLEVDVSTLMVKGMSPEQAGDPTAQTANSFGLGISHPFAVSKVSVLHRFSFPFQGTVWSVYLSVQHWNDALNFPPLLFGVKNTQAWQKQTSTVII